eukprot:1144583-Pelagomonas_calceolata.AAC.11
MRGARGPLHSSQGDSSKGASGTRSKESIDTQLQLTSHTREEPTQTFQAPSSGGASAPAPAPAAPAAAAAAALSAESRAAQAVAGAACASGACHQVLPSGQHRPGLAWCPLRRLRALFSLGRTVAHRSCVSEGK